ncbi:MAG: hypothetical protein PF436_09205 [Prolixibacteraceae bacterium]|jgi:hypothetical protein|nr:hypothetical protein [Prolixibacteraceae bacterium]
MRNILIILMLMVAFSCNPDRLKVDVSDIEASVEIYRVDSLLYAGSADMAIEKLSAFYENHQMFLDLYTQEILKLGEVGTDEFESNLRMFLNDSVYAEFGSEILKVFADLDDIGQQFESAYKHMLYYFPDAELPSIYTYVSGFNQSLMISDNFMGIALDKYLGSDCIFYQYLGIPRYLVKKMYPQKLVPDALYAWALTEYPYQAQTNHLLANMVYEGKLTYYVEAMLPEMPDTVIMGYSGEQLDWCKAHEAVMWTYLAEHKLLYSSDKPEVRKYIDNAPFTQTFTNDSPGRTGVWLGWQIVRSYMNNNPNVTLVQLMEMNDAQQFLSQSGYFPE